ncbi:MAG: DUF1223 domain-containing protein [Pyrinomonadaceae bacterium]
MLVVLSLAALGLFSISAAFNRDDREALTSPAAKTARSTSAVQGTSMPVIVELFTSEGCSSCPPADQLLSRLDKEQPVPGANVIALSQHVDYWNQLSWRDPYSSAQFSARQSSYAEAFGRDGVYTPQMVVDGRLEFVGSNATKAREAITEAASSPKAKVQIEITPNTETRESGTVQFTVRVEDIPAITAGDIAEVLVAITESDLSSSVARGENAGRNLRHTAVVRQLATIGSISKTKDEASFTAAPVVNILNKWRRDKLRAVVIVQERVSRHVLGAQAIELGAK